MLIGTGLPLASERMRGPPRWKDEVRCQEVPLILGANARGVRDDKPGHVTYEAAEEAGEK